MLRPTRNTLKKMALIGLAILLLAAVVLPPSQVFADAGISQVANENVAVYVDNTTGRFVIDTVEGHPQRTTDNDKSLLFGGTQPKTSFTTFRIGGEDFIYGNDYGFLGMDSSFVQQPLTAGLINQSVWQKNGVRITQTFTLVDDPDNENLGNVKITYNVDNTTGSAVSVGSRILLDSKMGENDASLVTLDGSPSYIQQETEVQGSDVPQYWRAAEHSNQWYDSGVVAYGMLSGWGNTRPDRLTIAHWEGIGTTKWDYAVDPDLDFSTTNNKYGSADSAVAMYWSPQQLASGESITYETYYGVGSIFDNGDEALPYNAVLSGPQKLTVNEAKDNYADGTFQIHMLVDNTFSNAELFREIQVELTLPMELELISGSAIQRDYAIVQGKTKLYSWTVKARPMQTYKAARYSVKLTGYMESIGDTYVIKTGNTLLPSLSGAPPLVQVQELLPAKKFTGDVDQKLNLVGTGFSLIQNDENVTLTLSRKNTEESKVFSLNDVTLLDDQLTIDLIKVWGSVPEVGVYELKLDAGQFGTYTRNVEFTSDQVYRSREYGLLGVTKTGTNYSLTPYENEAELNGLTDKPLLVFRGTVKEVNAKEFDILPGATINSVISFNQSEDVANWFGKAQNMTIRETNLGVDVDGMGTLSIPKFTFTSGQFGIKLKNGTSYSLNPDQSCRNTGTFPNPTFECKKKEHGYDDIDPDINTKPIQIEWPILTWLENNKVLDKLPVKLKSVTIGDGSVSFGGSVTLALGGTKSKQVANFPPEDSDWPPRPITTEEVEGTDPFTLSVDMHEARFGMLANNEFGLQGVVASGQVGMPTGLIPGVDFGVNAAVSINTFTPEYIIEVGASFEVIEVEGKLGLRFTPSGIPIIDSFVFAIGSEPGIPIAPVAPIAYLTKAGGGFENLYDTVMGNYKVVPPLTLVLIGGLDVAKVVEANNMRLSMSLQNIQFTGDFTIVGFPILDSVYGQIAIADTLDYTGIDVEIGASLTVGNLINGNVSATFSYDSRRTGLFGPVYLAGKGALTFSLPKSFPVGGGTKFAGIEAELSTAQVMGRLMVLGVKIGASYNWSSGEVELASLQGLKDASAGLVRIASALEGDASLQGIGNETIYDSSTGKQMGTMVFGTNITQGGQLKPIPKPKGKVTISAETAPYQYSLDVSAEHPNAVFQLKYDGQQPNVTVKTPSGVTYPLIEEQHDAEGYITQEGNYRLQEIPAESSESGLTEQWMYISALGTDAEGNPVSEAPAESGTWTISSDQPLEGSALNIAAMPEISNVTASIDGNQVDVTWDSTAADGKKVVLYITDSDQEVPQQDGENADFGRMMIAPDDDVLAEGGIASFTLPDNLPSGNYYVKAMLVDGEENLHSMISEDPVTFVNTATPVAPSTPTISSLGNGFIQTDWTYDADTNGAVDGFALQALDVNGEPIAGIGASLIEDGDLRTANIGGTYTSSETGEEAGIMPGETYKVAVSAYNLVGDHKVYSSPVISNAMFIPVPSPPEVELSLDEPWVEADNMYLTNKDTVSLNLSADQIVHADVFVDNKFRYNHNGDNWTDTVDLPEDGEHIIEVLSTNETTGDTTTTVLHVQRDRTAPELQIESPSRTEFITDSTIDVKGIAELGSDVTVNDEPVALAEDGTFHTSLSMSGYFSKTVKVAAVDDAGNRSEYEADVINKGQSFDRIEARVVGAEPYDKGVYSLAPGGLWDLEIVGVNDNGDELIMDEANIEWGMLLGDAYGSLTVDGQLDLQSTVAASARMEGELVVKASYALSDDYMLEDAITIAVEEGGRQKPDDDPQPPISTDTDTANDDKGSPIDQQMEALLRSLIEADGNITYTGGVMLSNDGETLVELDEHAVLTLFGSGAAFGYGKATNPSAYLFGKTKLLSDVYDFILSEPIDFDQPALFAVILPEDAGLGPDADKAGIYWFNDERKRWEFVGGEYDAQKGTISAKLSHFSKYALMLDPDRTIFGDIAGRWSENAVYRLNSIHVIDGYHVGEKWLYKPKMSISRQEFIKLLVTAAEIKLGTTTLPESYQDTEQVGDWAAPYINAALDKGWLSGVKRGDELWLEPRKEITRAEASVLISRMLRDQLQLEDAISSFSDQSTIPQWAAQSVATMQQHKLISGYPDGTFRADNSITREEAAQLIVQLIDWQYGQTKN